MQTLVHNIRQLGALSPQVQNTLEASRLSAEDMGDQVQTSLLILLEQEGKADEVNQFKARLDALQNQLVVLHSDLSTMVSDSEAEGWKARLESVRAQLQKLWGDVEAARKGALSTTEIRGLAWGLGTAAVGLAFGYIVWRARNKRTRRR